MALGAIGLAPSAAAAENFVEGFEDFTFPEQPSSPHYAYSQVGGSADVVHALAQSGTSALRLAGGVSTTVAFGASYNLCLQGIDLGARVESLGAGTGYIGLSNTAAFGTGANDHWFRLNYGTSQSIVLEARTGGSTTNANVVPGFIGLQAATWRTFGFECSGTQAVAFDYDNNFRTTITKSVAFNSLPYLIVSHSSGSGGDFRLDNIDFGVPAHAAIGEADSVAIPDLVGFDVDQTGTTILVRSDSGANVKAIAAQSLVVAATDPTGCIRSKGVAALAGHVSYLTCQVVNGDNVVTGLRIRSSTLGDPVYPGGCEDECQKDFSLATADDIAAGARGMSEITDLSLYPFDYSRRVQPNCFPTDCAYVPIVWAFSTTSGRLGLYADMNIGATPGTFPDDFDYDVVQFDTATSPQVNQICRATDPATGREYLYAGTANGVTKGYQVDVTISGGTSIDVNLQEPPVFDGLTSFSRATAIACDDDLLFLATESGQVWLVNRETKAALHAQPFAGSGASRGITMSDLVVVPGKGSFRYGAFVAAGGTHVTLVNLTSLESVGPSIEIPSGNFVGMEFDRNAQSLWIATSTGISRFDVHAVTTRVPVGTGQPAVQTTTAPARGVLNDVSGLATALSISEAAAGWFMGLMIIVAVGGGFYLISPKLGYFVGFAAYGLAIALGLIPLWSMLVLALLAAAVVVLKLRSG